MHANVSGEHFNIVSDIVSSLKGLDEGTQTHILRTVQTWLRLDLGGEGVPNSFGAVPTAPDMEPTGPQDLTAGGLFSARHPMPAKQFLLEKEPRTDIERLSCLAYYLTHFQDTPQFKTIDLSRLNTEAAQRKFTNAAATAKNAVRDGFFVPALRKGHRQLSPMAEQYVEALPDHDASAAIRKRMKPGRKRQKVARTKKARARPGGKHE